MPDRAPSPPGDPLLGHLRPFRLDVLGLLQRAARDHGDVVRFRLGPLTVHLVNHPDHVTRVLQTRAKHYDKATRSTAAIASIAGTSLLTANGQAWEARRRLMQPVFHRQRVGELADVMTRVTARRLAEWPPGATIDVASEMMRLAFEIAGTAILGVDVSEVAGALEGDVAFLLRHVYTRWGRPVPVPSWVPTRENRRFDAALARVDDVVTGIVQRHRARPDQAPPLLGLLMEADDPDTGAPFTDARLRDEVITMLLAGHETTASALAWTLARLSQHPEVESRVRAEVDETLGQRTPTLADMPALRYTTQVLQESLRLSPPIWAIERRAIDADTIAGVAIPAGSSVIVSPYVLHRHQAFWPDPERFDPDRFSAAGTPDAYLPFGAGPRYCIGAEFAMLEARLVLAMVLQGWRLDAMPGQTLAPDASLTLRVRGGWRAVVTRR
ncbi:MAG: cytochrome P450 [Vicinamibacterales bacterium]